MKLFLALACLAAARVADAQCTSHASCAVGEWCGSAHGTSSGDVCIAVDDADASTYCTCGTSGSWFCPPSTEDPASAVAVLGSTCCRLQAGADHVGKADVRDGLPDWKPVVRVGSGQPVCGRSLPEHYR